MKALSIRQPWIWAILECGKTVENRVWPTNYRGPILLHASQGMTLREYYDFYNDVFCRSAPFSYEVLKRHTEIPDSKELLRGGIVGSADLVDCLTESASPWFFGPYGFVLANVRPLPFLPYKGRLGLFHVDESPAAKYKLDQLIAECDPAAPINETAQEWLDAPPVGREVI